MLGTVLIVYVISLNGEKVDQESVLITCMYFHLMTKYNFFGRTNK